MSETPTLPGRQIAPQKRDAIHRALLTGLLSSVATRIERHEYAGPRNVRLSVHPGSGLFRNQPQWLMAAEMVETTKLYARTIARVQPPWIERAGEHLLKRSYSDPRWDEHSHHVNADEKVTLFGLVLVPRRTVNYGPIDPKVSRQLFIQHALVDGRFKTSAPFFRRNHEQIEQVRQMEAKVRRRDLLVEPHQLFAFYDQRLPAEVYDGPSFENWFRHAEQHHRHQLLMALSDIVAPGAPPIDPARYPDHVQVGPHRLRVSYHFEPGHDADGVTVTVPLALLNQLDPRAFDWLIPGWIEERTVELIRTLPRPVRTRLVPAPEFSTRALQAMTFGEGSFLATLADRLGNLVGEVIPLSEFNPDGIPCHLAMRVRVVDEGGRTLAASRDLRELKERLADVTRQAFRDLPDTRFNRSNVTRWDFGDLPDSVTIRRPGITVLGYPAVAEEQQQAHLRLMDSPESAERAMRAGSRRLFLVQLGGELKYLARNIPGWSQMALRFAPIGPVERLRDTLLQAAADEALFGVDSRIVRTQRAFAERAAEAWKKLGVALDRVAGDADAALAAGHAVPRMLERGWPDRSQPALRDVRQQVAALLPPEFALSTPAAWRPHLARYLRAIEQRLTKLSGSTGARDAELMSQVRPLWQRYLDRVQRKPRLAEHPDMVQYRWMIEEFRVSLFAQELKTAFPVSQQRLDKLWAGIRE